MSAEASVEPASPAPLSCRFLMVTHIPVYYDGQGKRWVDPLWKKDLLLHLDYIRDFSLASPRLDGAKPAFFEPIDDTRIQFIDLPGTKKHTINLPRTAYRLWTHIGRAEVLQFELGGWLPFSTGNLCALFGCLRRRFLLVIVESAPWRMPSGSRWNLYRRFQSWLAEVFNRRCVNVASLAIFTQEQYRQSLLTRHPDRGYIIHASWVDDEWIMSTTLAEACWLAKTRVSTAPLRILFAGRLTAAKGMLALLECMTQLEAAGCSVQLDILGEGDLRSACQEAADRPGSHTRIRLLGVVAYGPEFFELISGYHAVVVPSISDEQPRIVYDAYSQGVPILASDTPGLRDCVTEGRHGAFFTPNDSGAMKSCIQWAALNRDVLMRMGMAGLARAREMTHREMHRRRWILLDRYLNRGSRT